MLSFLTALITFVSFAATSEAYTVIFNNPAEQDYVVGIDNLPIEGRNYDVQFVSGTFLGVFGDPIRQGFPPDGPRTAAPTAPPTERRR